METRIASYQEPGVRLQLVQIEKEDIGTDGMPTSLGITYYQIRQNRKVLFNTKDDKIARNRFFIYVNSHLFQTKLKI